jgi:CRISPR-associated protein Csm3
MQIQGKVIIRGKIKAKTGLHIGGASTGLEIGGVDKMVVRNPLNNQPYIPGSSLKGKLRALLERAGGFAKDGNRVWVKRGEVSMHLCNRPDCYLCLIFGRNNAKQTPYLKNQPQFEITRTTPTRLIVRDGALDADALNKLKEAQTDLPYTEIKWEVGIDRITSAANPRQMERVPAGAEFAFEMVYTVYDQHDRTNLKRVFEAMQLLEHDYLGGQGSRGSGQIEFAQLSVDWYPRSFYETGDQQQIETKINGSQDNVQAVLTNFAQVQQRVVWPDAPPERSNRTRQARHASTPPATSAASQPEALEIAEAPAAPEVSEAPEVAEAPEIAEPSEVSEVPAAPETSELPEVAEAPEVQDDIADSNNNAPSTE